MAVTLYTCLNSKVKGHLKKFWMAVFSETTLRSCSIFPWSLIMNSLKISHGHPGERLWHRQGGSQVPAWRSGSWSGAGDNHLGWRRQGHAICGSQSVAQDSPHPHLRMR